MNDNVVILPTLARASTTNSPDQDNPYYAGGHFALTVTASGVAGGSVVLAIEGKAEPPDAYYQIGTGTQVGNGTLIVKIYPGLVVAGNNFNDNLPRIWRVKATHTESVTYGISASLLG